MTPGAMRIRLTGSPSCDAGMDQRSPESESRDQAERLRFLRALAEKIPTLE